MSTFFENLFERLPEAEQLLRLEPEQLARHLLLSLGTLESYISSRCHSLWKHESAMQMTRHLNYPSNSHEEVLFALMEAWQWLKNEGFVAPRPQDLPSGDSRGSATRYFVTRRGRQSIRRINELPV